MGEDTRPAEKSNSLSSIIRVVKSALLPAALVSSSLETFFIKRPVINAVPVSCIWDVSSSYVHLPLLVLIAQLAVKWELCTNAAENYFWSV